MHDIFRKKAEIGNRPITRYLFTLITTKLYKRPSYPWPDKRIWIPHVWTFRGLQDQRKYNSSLNIKYLKRATMYWPQNEFLKRLSLSSEINKANVTRMFNCLVSNNYPFMMIIIFVPESKLKIFWLIFRFKKKHENVCQKKIVIALCEIMATMHRESATLIGCREY
jgi:hypothetical protein